MGGDPRLSRSTLELGGGVPSVRDPGDARGVPRALIAVAATDFYFRDVDAFLRTLSPSQRVAVVLDSPALIVVGTSHPCADPAEQASGQAADLPSSRTTGGGN